MAETMLSNLVDPEVFADGVAAKLGNNIKLYPISYVQDLEGQAGGTIVVPKMAYIGDADQLTEGTAMVPVAMSQTTETLVVQEYGKAVEISDKALKNALGLDSLLNEAENQIARAIANKIEKELFAKLVAIDGNNGTLLYQGQAGETALNLGVLAKALEKLGEDQDGQKYLIVDPAGLTQLRQDPSFQIKDITNATVDVAGNIFGMDVIVSNNVPVKTAFIYKPNALGLYLKKNVAVEIDRDILKRSNVIAGSAQWACHLRDVTGAVKIQLAAS